MEQLTVKATEYSQPLHLLWLLFVLLSQTLDSGQFNSFQIDKLISLPLIDFVILLTPPTID